MIEYRVCSLQGCGIYKDEVTEAYKWTIMHQLPCIMKWQLYQKMMQREEVENSSKTIGTPVKAEEVEIDAMLSSMSSIRKQAHYFKVIVYSNLREYCPLLMVTLQIYLACRSKYIWHAT